MYHSLTLIRDNVWVNTWDQLHLIPTERPVIQPPEAKINMVPIPGALRPLDISETEFGMREGNVEFIIVREYYQESPMHKSWGELAGMTWEEVLEYTWANYSRGQNVSREWYEAFAVFMNEFDGRLCKLVLEDDPTFYYEGRVEFMKMEPGENWSDIAIQYTLRPHKRLLTDSSVLSL